MKFGYTINNKLMMNSNGKLLGVEVNDPYNPLNLPQGTIRVRTNDGLPPVNGNYDTATLVEGTYDVYDVYKSGSDFDRLLRDSTNVIQVLGGNTRIINHIYYTFAGCTSLTSVALFDTSNVRDFSHMFDNCSSLVTVPLFDTSKAHSLRGMFNLCKSIETIPLYDTSNANYLGYMCWGCFSLTNIPLFDTSKVTIMNEMFWRCYKVESGALALYQQASTQSTPPTDYSGCFHACGLDTQTGSAELAQIPSDWK